MEGTKLRFLKYKTQDLISENKVELSQNNHNKYNYSHSHHYKSRHGYDVFYARHCSKYFI